MAGLKVYVATKFEHSGRAAEIADLLEEYGHTITYRWWRHPQDSMVQAVLDLRGVADADVLVAILEKDLPYAGTFAEIGAALVLGKPVYVIGEAGKQLIFLKHPNVKVGIGDLL